MGEGLGLFLALVFRAVPAWPYFALLESSRAQATLGKRLFGLRVTDQSGRRLELGRASLRHFSKLLSVLPFCLGFIVIAFSTRKRGWHDMVAGTVVIWKQ